MRAITSVLDPNSFYADPDSFGSVPVSLSRIQARDPFLSVLGSGSVSYSNEHNKIKWKGKLNKKYLLVGAWQACWQWKSSEDVEKVLFRYITSLKRVRIRIRIKKSDTDPYQSEKQDPYQSEKQDPDQNGLDPQHWSGYSQKSIVYLNPCTWRTTV